MKKEFRSFEHAKKFVHTLKLKNQKEWELYRKSKNKPKDIPTGPAYTYKNKGWTNLGDWLGTGTIASQNKKYKTFDDARKFVQKLKLKNDSEWRKFYMSDARPSDIPTAPNVVYKSEWNSLGDWLGTGTKSPKEISKKYWSFEKSREYVHNLGLQSGTDWEKYCKSDKKSEHIPTVPRSIYKNKGWISMDDWLGHGKVSNSHKNFLTYKEARSIVRKLKLSGGAEWRKYSKLDSKQENIPSSPEKVYKNKGWISWGDWLGTGTISVKEISKKYWSYEKSKKFMHTLHLKNEQQWREFFKTNNRPEGIPSNPQKVYKKEWIGIGDWLGTGTIATQDREYISYQEAKQFVQSLGLKNRKDWINAVKTGKIPKNIPNNPWHVYSKKRLKK